MSDRGANTTYLQGLIDDVSSGNPRAGDEVVELASQRWHRLTRKMLSSYSRLKRWGQTDDVFQAATLRLYESLNEVQPESVRNCSD